MSPPDGSLTSFLNTPVPPKNHLTWVDHLLVHPAQLQKTRTLPPNIKSTARGQRFPEFSVCERSACVHACACMSAYERVWAADRLTCSFLKHRAPRLHYQNLGTKAASKVTLLLDVSFLVSASYLRTQTPTTIEAPQPACHAAAQCSLGSFCGWTEAAAAEEAADNRGLHCVKASASVSAPYKNI